jgi:hypothetical protein
MTVEKRERPVKSGSEESHQSLKKAQKEEIDKEISKDKDKKSSAVYDASEALKAVAAFARESDAPSS